MLSLWWVAVLTLSEMIAFLAGRAYSDILRKRFDADPVYQVGLDWEQNVFLHIRQRGMLYMTPLQARELASALVEYAGKARQTT